MTLRELEKYYILETLKNNNSNRTKTAKILDITGEAPEEVEASELEILETVVLVEQLDDN